MKIVLVSVILAGGLVDVVPASAQGVYIGPNGVGVDSGFGYGHRGYYRDRYRDDRRYDRDDGYYEGRSASRGYRHRDYFYDHY